MKYFIFEILILTIIKDIITQECNFKNHDFSALDWQTWIVRTTKQEIYKINLCRPLVFHSGPEKDNCTNSAICMLKNGTAKSLVNFPLNTYSFKNEKNSYKVEFKGPVCSADQRINETITLTLICGENLGAPELNLKWKCNTQFIWKTSAACNPLPKIKEVPCYVYDKDGNKRDLSHLILSKGHYSVESTDSEVEFYINVCSEIKGDKYAPQGSAAYQKIGNETINYGNPVSGIFISHDNDLKLIYNSTEISVKPNNCTNVPHTIITFKCPQRGKSHIPRVVFIANCQYNIEWETEYACSEKILKGNFNECTFTSKQHGVELDLSPLKNKSGYYLVSSNETTFALNVCGGIGTKLTCNGQSWKMNSVCKIDKANESEVIGITKNAELRFVDGRILLTYISNTLCKDTKFTKSSVIEFECAETEGIGEPVYNSVEDCKYFFKWRTKYACLKYSGSNGCYVNDGNVHINLELLMKRNGERPWEVINALEREEKNTYFLNICSEVTNSNESYCKLGSSICKIDENNKVISLGKFISSPIYNKKFKTVEIIYENGEQCENGEYKTHITLYCKPGVLDSSPVLKTITNEGCLYEIEWHTAAACPQMVKKGKDCKVFDDDLGFTLDLNPLKSDKYYEIKSQKYIYYLNVCGPIKGTKCDQTEGETQNAAACQEDIEGGRFWKLGQPNNELFYIDGMINLTYTLGTPYNNANNTPRMTSITFICDHKAGTGYPEFIEEINQAYFFKWNTSYACPSNNAIKCIVRDHKNEIQYDFQRLTKTSKDGNWVVTHNKDQRKRKFYLNMCQPLNPVEESCSSDSFACLIDTNEEGQTTVHNLGKMVSEPKLNEQGHLTIKYVSGDTCNSYGTTSNYTTLIHFLCDYEKEELRFLGELGNCEYMFLWTTEVACGIKTERSKNKCSIVDPLTKYTLDFHSLMKKDGYNVTADFRNFQLNICGTASGCLSKDKNVSVCEVIEGKNNEILGLLKDYSLELSEDKSVTLIYEGIYNQSIGTMPKVYIKLQCSEALKQNDIKFVRQDDSSYFFELETSLACIPDQIDCTFTDSFGNEYDLTRLTKWKYENWDASDIHSNHKYHINFCKPLNPSQHYKCPAGEVISCQTSTDKEESFNLGYFKEKPVIHTQGIITVHYKDGMPCHGGQFNRSTRINLRCSSKQKDLVFIGETEECEYIFSMDTPAACPIESTVGSHCSVKTADYGYTFDLNSLHQDLGQYTVKTGQYEYILNVCGKIKNSPENCKNAAACQTKPSDINFAVNTGMPNSELYYNSGVIQLIYESGKGNCHGKFNRSTVITFTCDQSTNGTEGPIFLEEKYDCTYMFEWPTSLVCLPYSVQECSTDDGKLHYDLSPLSLSDNNYVIHFGKNSLFAINICRSIVTSNGIQCPSSAACIIDFSKSDKPKETNIGKVSSPYIENDKLKLRYNHGEKCELPFPSDKGNFETVIEFECEEKLTDSEPQFIGKENCTYYFTWSTAFACPIKDDDDTEKNCVVENPATGYKYNLSSLKKNIPYEVMIENSPHKFYLNVCGGVKNTRCGPNVGSCQQDKENNKKWNAGQANSRLHFHEGMLFLNYTDGDICHGKFPRSTIIEFKCNNETEEPIFQFESEDCTYYFIWLTPLACENKIHCTVSNGSDVFDLTPLKLSKSSYSVNDLTGKRGLYYLNICDSVKLFKTNCPPNAGICKIINGSALSLGNPSPPMIDFEGYVSIIYPDGSFCDKGVKSTSRIIFLCDTSIEMGEPELVTFNEECHYVFQWKTNLVCPKTNIFENPSSTNCTYTDKKRGINIDLSPLRKMNSSYVVKSKRNTYLINICGSVNSSKLGCTTSGVCRQGTIENENYGSVNNASFSYDAQTLTLNYSEGGNCIMNFSGKRSSRILFVCDPKAGIGEPKVLKESTCFAVFIWKTNLVCPVFHQPCSLYSGGQHYDLQLLSSLSHNWNATDDKGNIYWLNICRETRISESFLNCQNSAVCMKDIKNEIVSLGNSQSQELYTGRDGNIILSYTDGSNSICSKKDSYAKTNIRFVCGNTLSTPKYVSGPNDECVFEFLWKTRIACAEEKKQVILENNGIIFDSRLNSNIDLSPLLNRTFSVDGTHFDDTYIYIINIEKGIKDVISAEECKSAAVCQTKNGVFYRDIGSLATRKFYLKGTELQLELISLGRKCGKNHNKNVTTIINFVCVEDAGIGRPIFYYESGNCDYLFQWETALACINNFKSATDSSSDINDKDSIVNNSVSSTVQIIFALLLSSILVAIIIFIVSKKERRNAVKHKVSTVFSHICIPKCFNRNEGESLLLSSSVITTYHDDSDVEILT